MNFYSAYGLNIESEIALPELTGRVGATQVGGGDNGGGESGGGESGGGENDRVIMRRDERARRGGDGTFCGDGTFRTKNAEEAFVSLPGVGCFLMRGGRDISFAPDESADESAIRLFLLGTGLAVLMHQRGSLVLHASAVSVDGGAVAFMGASGQGKSTTAAALHALGYDLVSDDLVPVDLTIEDCGAPRVFPGYAQIKLWPEAAQALNAGQLQELHPQSKKGASRISQGFRDQPLPLRRIFVLDAAPDGSEEEANEGTQNAVLAPHEYSCEASITNEESGRIQVLAPREACMELVRHSYCFPLIDELRREDGVAHLRQCADLARRVPICNLRSRFAKKGLAALPDLAKLVLDDLANDAFFHPGENDANSRNAS